MKKIITFIALAVLSLNCTAFAAFSDMSGKSGEMQQAVELLTANGYVKGVSDNKFAPDNSITRAEFAAVVLRMLNKMGEFRPYYLKDVPKNSWYYYVAGSAAESGILSGYEDKTFRGDTPLTKVQALTIISNVLQQRLNIHCPANSSDYYGQIPLWAVNNIALVLQEGIISENDIIYMDSNISRGDCAVFLARLYTRIKDTGLFPYTGTTEQKRPPITIVIDPGHGKSSWEMDDDERIADGWVYDSGKEQWGEWRHWKSYTTWHDCNGSGCNENNTCWYKMTAGDRGEPENSINLNNAKSAVKYLREMGYDVRLTRGSNDENPSMTKRLIYCYPNNDTTAVPDADLFVCLHSNAGGGKGSAYVELAGKYDQADIPADYVQIGNTLGKYINEEIVNTTSMSKHGDGCIEGLPYLILFCKSPVPIAYMEIGFYDNSKDKDILQAEYDAIGKAIAAGIDKYCKDANLKG